LSKIFPSIAAEYDDMKAVGKLPSLLTSDPNGEEYEDEEDPFGKKNKRF